MLIIIFKKFIKCDFFLIDLFFWKKNFISCFFLFVYSSDFNKKECELGIFEVEVFIKIIYL